MLDYIMTIVYRILMVLGICIICYIPFYILPLELYGESQCLKRGYPKVSVTIGGEIYCSTLEGVVRPSVVPLKEAQ